MVLKRFKKLVPQNHTLKNREQLQPFIIKRHILTNIVSHESRKSSEINGRGRGGVERWRYLLLRLEEDRSSHKQQKRTKPKLPQEEA